MRSLSPVLALAPLLLAAPALAQMAETTRQGDWRVLSGRSPAGAESCALSSVSPSGDRELRITWERGTPGVAFTLVREGWRIPPGTPIRVVMQLDRQPPINVRTARGEGDRVSFSADRERFAAFSPGFGSGTVLRVAFPDGDEPAWTVSLRGSSAALDAWWRCLGGEAAPQPFGRDGGTQPFGRPAPQPFRPAPGQLPL